MTNKNTNRSVTYNSLLQAFVYFFEEQIIALVVLCSSKGITNREIAKALGVHESQVSKKYKKYIEKGKHE